MKMLQIQRQQKYCCDGTFGTKTTLLQQTHHYVI